MFLDLCFICLFYCTPQSPVPKINHSAPNIWPWPWTLTLTSEFDPRSWHSYQVKRGRNLTRNTIYHCLRMTIDLLHWPIIPTLPRSRSTLTPKVKDINQTVQAYSADGWMDGWTDAARHIISSGSQSIIKIGPKGLSYCLYWRAAAAAGAAAIVSPGNKKCGNTPSPALMIVLIIMSQHDFSDVKCLSNKHHEHVAGKEFRG